MKTYYIYNNQTDEFLGEVMAVSIIDAEIKASAKFDVYSDELYAFSEKL
ncbi:MAG: hypothetical protein NC548_31230 [Lachnospiraceae bacterium]|nr:hypothetical protein [Bacteroides fragilis]MCM1218977.1 hypothetical protein [Lachnospiraceae bacterium]